MNLSVHLQPWSISADDFPTSGFAAERLEHLLGYAVLVRHSIGSFQR